MQPGGMRGIPRNVTDGRVNSPSAKPLRRRVGVVRLRDLEVSCRRGSRCARAGCTTRHQVQRRFLHVGNSAPLYKAAGMLGPYELVGPWKDDKGRIHPRIYRREFRCLKHAARANRCGRAKVYVGVGTIEESLNKDMRVSKPLCSRCALNVSFWGILWHSVSDPDARNRLKGKASS